MAAKTQTKRAKRNNNSKNTTSVSLVKSTNSSKGPLVRNLKKKIKKNEPFSIAVRGRLRKEAVNSLSSVVLKDIDKISDEQLLKIVTILKVTPSYEKEILDFLEGLGIPKVHAKIIQNKILEYCDDIDDIVSYFKDRKIKLEDVITGERCDFLKELRHYGFDSNLVTWIMDYAWAESPAIGKAEVGLAIFLDGGKRTTKGDLGVYSEIIEVKGNDGRLKAQKEHGDQTSVKKGFVKGFKDLVQIRSISYDIPSDIMGKDDLSWNFTRDNWLCEKISKDLFAMNVGVTVEDISYAIAKGLSAYFMYMDEKVLEQWIAVFINPNGSIDRKGFLRKLSVEAFRYYQNSEKFDKMICYNRKLAQKGKPCIFGFEVKNLTQYLEDEIFIAPGCYGKSSGPQAIAHSINLK